MRLHSVALFARGTIMSVFEVIMLICFGFAWPFSIYRSWKSKSVRGKSLAFLFIVMAGYLAGIMHKVFFNYDNVIYLYITNFSLVSIDTALYIRNRKEREVCEGDDS
jgi:hypothetical protein